MVPQSENEHFLIDNVTPPELDFALQTLDLEDSMTTEELRASLLERWNYKAQLNLSFTTRRLIDLGAAQRTRKAGKPAYSLSEFGAKLRALRAVDPVMYKEVAHYLHYDRYDGDPDCNKLFWSYYHCCDIVWGLRRMPQDDVIVAEIQSRIAVSFPDLYTRASGGFNKGGVSSGWRPWVAQLEPAPFPDKIKVLIPRTVTRFELSLLALDRAYRQRGYQYGDPVLLDDDLLDETAAVFFLDLACCRELLERAARLDRSLTLRSTFSGTSLTLHEPYTVERL